MQQTVGMDRDKYIGGSDIPVILGLSPYKTRFDLLLEKAGYIVDDFEGNIYTEYGNKLEPLIRQHVSGLVDKQFVEDKLIHGEVRCHVDGWDCNDTILEIKTTGKLCKTLKNKKYLGYLSQLLFYMHHFNASNGLLAIYRRDFSSDIFITKNLQLWEVNPKDHEELMSIILTEVDRFIEDVEVAKNNPLINEQDFRGGYYE